MDEARSVLDRLDRIAALEAAEVPAAILLKEVCELVREAEAWLAVEPWRMRPEPATAVERCRLALEEVLQSI